MIELIYGQDERVIAWATARIPNCRFRDDAKGIGGAIGGELVGAFVFDQFSSQSCFASIASDGSKRWMSRKFVVHGMAYPFLQCGFKRLNVLISERNANSIRFCLHFGGVLEGRLREAGPDDEDMLIFGVLRRDCPYLPENKTRWRDRRGGAPATQSFYAGKTDPAAL